MLHALNGQFLASPALSFGLGLSIIYLPDLKFLSRQYLICMGCRTEFEFHLKH